jgi:hypothetical protein
MTKARRPVAEPAPLKVGNGRPGASGGVTRGDLLVGLLAVVIAVGAVLASRRALSNPHVLGFTRLWVSQEGPGRLLFTAANTRIHPGSFVFTVTVAGHRVLRQSVTLPAAALYRVRVALGPSTAPRQVVAVLTPLPGTRTTPETVHLQLPPVAGSDRPSPPGARS